MFSVTHRCIPNLLPRSMAALAIGAKLFHLQPSGCRISIGIKVVRSPIVGEAQRTIKLRWREPGTITDIQSRDVSRATDGDVPAIAVIDHLLRGSAGCNAF